MFESGFCYTDANPTYAHHYLIRSVMKMLPPASLHKDKKTKVLDIGAGNGSFCNHLSENGYESVGIELSEAGVEIAKKNFPTGQFFCASVYDKPMDEYKQAFDCVVSMEVIEHLIYPRELLKAAQYYLRPGGSMIITTPYHGFLKNMAISMLNKWDAHFSALWDGGHVKFFSVNTLSAILQEGGWDVCEYDYAGRLPFLWKSMICLAKKKE